MAYQGSKGWYVKELRKLGVNKHPIDRRNLKLYKTSVVRNLYLKYKEQDKREQ